MSSELLYGVMWGVCMCDGRSIPTSASDRIVDELNPERNLARSDIESLIEPPVGASVTGMHITALMQSDPPDPTSHHSIGGGEFSK